MGSSDVMGDRDKIAMARRRIISENLSAEERSLFRAEMDVAQRISLNSAGTSSHRKDEGGEEAISDARSIRSYRCSQASVGTKNRMVARKHNGPKILKRPEKKRRIQGGKRFSATSGTSGT